MPWRMDQSESFVAYARTSRRHGLRFADPNGQVVVGIDRANLGIVRNKL